MAVIRPPGAAGGRLGVGAPRTLPFFGCLYYAALRPAEAVALRVGDCVLPAKSWGRIDLATSGPRARTEWTDTGASHEHCGLKHRADKETRSIPIPPVLVAMLRGHRERQAQYFDPISLGGLIVAIATLAWAIYADQRKATPAPSPDAVARAVRVELRTQDDAYSEEHEKITGIVVTEVIKNAAE